MRKTIIVFVSLCLVPLTGFASPTKKEALDFIVKNTYPKGDSRVNFSEDGCTLLGDDYYEDTLLKDVDLKSVYGYKNKSFYFSMEDKKFKYWILSKKNSNIRWMKERRVEIRKGKSPDRLVKAFIVLSKKCGAKESAF